MGAFEVTRIDSTEGFEALRPVWKRLVDAGNHPNVFLTFEWLFSWWETFGSDHELYILAVRSGDEIVALAPLMLTRKGGRGRVVQFIGTPDSDYCDFPSTNSGETTPAILDYLMRRRADWTKLDLEQISERSSTVQHVAAYFELNRAAYRFRPAETCHSLVYEAQGEARESFARRRNKTLKWSINFFKRSGALTLSELKTNEAIEPWLDYLFHYHLMRWSDTITPSKFADRRHRRLYRTLAARLASSRQISLLLLKHDGLPIAFQFDFVYGNSVFVYTLAHNVFFRRQSPGKILNHLATQHYIRAGYDELDFTRGGETYKGSLTNRTFANYELKVYRNRVCFWLSLFYDRLKASRPMARLARSDRLSDLKNRLMAGYEDYGLTGMARTAVGQAWRRIVDCKTVTIFKHDRGGERFEPPHPVRLEKVGKDRLVAIASLYGLVEDSPRCREFAYRFDIGQDCFTASVNGRTIGAVWGSRHEYRLPEAGELLLGEREVMFIDAYASPAGDVPSVLPSLLSYSVEHYRRRKYTVLFACSEDAVFDIDSLRQVGFVPSARKHFLRLLGARIV